MARARNAHYHVPPRTVLLGMVLDLTIEHAGERVTLTDEVLGWVMATTEAGMDAAPGRARLYLFPASDTELEVGDDSKFARARETFERWHAREAEQVTEAEVPDTVGYFQGRLIRLGYRSDKWGPRGDCHDYDHSFTEHDALAPKFYSDTEELEGMTAAVVTGGGMSITEAGID